MIIDAHVHVHTPETIRDWKDIAESEPYFGLLAGGKVQRWATAADVLAAMAQDGIDESWICGFAFNDLGRCREANDYVLEACAGSGGRLRPLCVVPPLARGAAAEVERCAALGAIGVGELFPDGQVWCVDDVRETWRLAAVCHENSLFLSVHAAEPVGRDYPGKGRTGPRELFALARNHPELRILMAHLGGGLFLYETMADAELELQNVYYDIAALPFLYDARMLSAAMAIVPQKLLYGSDFPILRYPRYRAAIEGTVNGGGTAALFSENARRMTAF